MIINKIPLTLAEVKANIKDLEERQQLKLYLKKFTKISEDKAKSLAEEIKVLGNLKIKEENIVKIVDLLPQDQEDLNKILTEVALNEEETNAILEIVKKY